MAISQNYYFYFSQKSNDLNRFLVKFPFETCIIYFTLNISFQVIYYDKDNFHKGYNFAKVRLMKVGSQFPVTRLCLETNADQIFNYFPIFHYLIFIYLLSVRFYYFFCDPSHERSILKHSFHSDMALQWGKVLISNQY